MRMPDQEPVTVSDGRDGTKTTHPAFGQIRASRVSGHTTLYGSDFMHHAYIVIGIHTSELHRSLSRDWHHAMGEVIEVALSEAQWATFVSSLNVGSGVPCTIDHILLDKKPGIPLRREETHFKAEIGATVSKAVENLRALKAKVSDAASGLSKAKAESLLTEIDAAIMGLNSNLPFVEQSFNEHVETTIEKAKIEVHGYMQGVVARAGFKALSKSEPEPLAITFDGSKP